MTFGLPIGEDELQEQLNGALKRITDLERALSIALDYVSIVDLDLYEMDDKDAETLIKSLDFICGMLGQTPKWYVRLRDKWKETHST